jgi:excisionase family DNA binding protein
MGSVMKKNAATHRKILTVEEVAEIRKTTPSAIRLLAWRGQIPHFKSGRRLLFDEAEVFAWLESQRRVTLEQALQAVSR